MSSYELDEIGGHERPPTVAARVPRREPQERRCPMTWRKFSVGISILIASLMIAILVVLVYYNVNEKSSKADPGTGSGSGSDIADPQASIGEDETASDDTASDDSASDDSASDDSASDDSASDDTASDDTASNDTVTDGYNLKVVQKIITNPQTNSGSIIAVMFNENIVGPAIHVKNGSWVTFRVTNGIADKNDNTANLGLSIHWHGLNMWGAQIFDGVVGLTQCPIMENKFYDYTWQINEEPGTYWYHQHDRKMFPDKQTDFIRGPLIIHPSESDLDLPPPDTEPKHSYQVGNERILFFTDGLLNGESKPKISVNAGSEYRFRIINAVHSMPSSLMFSIGAEFGNKSKGGRIPLTVIATDAYPVVDFEVDVINIAIAERYDVTVTFPDNASNTNAYIYGEHKGEIFAAGILLIGGGENTDIVPKAGEMTAETRVLNCYNFSESYVANNGTCIPVTNLTSTKIIHHFDKFDAVQTYDIGDAGEKQTFHFNVALNGGKALKNRIPCHALIKRSSQNIYPGGTAIMALPTNKSVTIMLRVQSNNDKPGGGIHPMHMHGHHYEVLGIANGENNQECKLHSAEHYFGETIKELEKRKGVLKDTVVLPVCGAVVLRINTDNPGVWFFHCHIDWHLHHGLAAVINEGNYMFSQTEFPDDYPSCRPCGL